MLFAVGNMASRPNIGQLLGVLRVDEPMQTFIVWIVPVVVMGHVRMIKDLSDPFPEHPFGLIPE